MIATEVLGAARERQEEAFDQTTAAPLRRLAALLDRPGWPWRDGEVPPLGHWLFHLPETRQGALGEDGHPTPSGLIPATGPPRRMWASGQVTFHAPLPLGCKVLRRSTLAQIKRKSGAQGEMVFVTLRHELISGGRLRLTDQQDLVYLPAGPRAAKPATSAPERPAEVVRRMTADPVMLFRYSALTFNAHRIHYDRDYATRIEHYPDLVVQGPLLATLLLDHFRAHHPDAKISTFRFRAHAPVFAGRDFDLCLATDPQSAELWIRDAEGAMTMSAAVTVTGRPLL